MSDVHIEYFLKDLLGATTNMSETLASIDEQLEGIKDALWLNANVGRLAASLMEGGAINIRQHEPLCIGAPLGLKLTPSQCDEIGKFVADAIRSGALKLTKAIAKPGTCIKCGCTATNACTIEKADDRGGKSLDACFWVNVDETLCSACVEPEPAAGEAS